MVVVSARIIGARPIRNANEWAWRDIPLKVEFYREAVSGEEFGSKLGIRPVLLSSEILEWPIDMSP